MFCKEAESRKATIMRPTLTLGVDVSSRTLVCALFDFATDKVRSLGKFENNEADIRRLLGIVPEEAVVVAEPTGRYSHELVRIATETGRDVRLAPTDVAKLSLRAHSPRCKNDPVDSVGLARFGCNKDLRPYTLKTEGVERLDQLQSVRRAVAKAVSGFNQQGASLSMVGSEIGKVVEALKKRLAELDAQIEELTETDEQFAVVARFREIPGVGAVTSAAAASRLVSKHFVSADAFVAYVGLDVRVAESGKRKGKAVLSRRGDAEMRRLFYLCAQASIRCKSSPYRETYQRLTKEKGMPTTKALCAIARKIAMMCWSIERYGTRYDPARVHQNPARRQNVEADSQASAGGERDQLFN
jgi:transposase